MKWAEAKLIQFFIATRCFALGSLCFQPNNYKSITKQRGCSPCTATSVSFTLINFLFQSRMVKTLSILEWFVMNGRHHSEKFVYLKTLFFFFFFNAILLKMMKPPLNASPSFPAFFSIRSTFQGKWFLFHQGSSRSI